LDRPIIKSETPSVPEPPPSNLYVYYRGKKIYRYPGQRHRQRFNPDEFQEHSKLNEHFNDHLRRNFNAHIVH